MKRILAFGFSIIAVYGCVSPPAPLISMPRLPDAEVDIIEVNVLFENDSNLEENTVQIASREIERDSTIVINVPSGLFEEQSKQNAKSQDFKTKDFFNEAEQQIEKVLIKKGFRVLSRSKFEAKLRTLRDETRCDIYTFRCLHSQVAPEIKPILEALKEKFDKGEINAHEYSEEISRFREKHIIASAGRKREEGDDELTDISEVIRAAESGNIQADYILQINTFDTETKIRVSKDLLHYREVREFIGNHPEIRAEFENGPNIISCSIAGAEFNAKLIYVRTGEISWIGEHHLDEFSAGVQNILVEIGSRRALSNKMDIETFVRQQNTDIERRKRYGKIVEYPYYEYREFLIKPTISAGRCNKNSSPSRKTKSRLARQVAKELISTIRVQ